MTDPKQLQEWRDAALAGTLTPEQMRDAIVHLRASRMTAMQTAAIKKSRKKAKDDAAPLEGL